MTRPLRATAASEPLQSVSKLRFGLCCQFVEQPIQFRTTTATSLLRMKPTDQRLKLSRLCLANAESLLLALQYCADNDIGSFPNRQLDSTRQDASTSRLLGRRLAGSDVIVAAFRRCGDIRRRAQYSHGISSRSIRRAEFAT